MPHRARRGHHPHPNHRPLQQDLRRHGPAIGKARGVKAAHEEGEIQTHRSGHRQGTGDGQSRGAHEEGSPPPAPNPRLELRLREAALCSSAPRVRVLSSTQRSDASAEKRCKCLQSDRTAAERRGHAHTHTHTHTRASAPEGGCTRGADGERVVHLPRPRTRTHARTLTRLPQTGSVSPYRRSAPHPSPPHPSPHPLSE